MKSIALGNVSGIALTLLLATPAIAQETVPSSNETVPATSVEPVSGSARTLGTVTVTAQRREESLQDAAIAVDAFDEDSLVRAGLESAQDLGQLSPSLGVNAGGGPLTSLFLRGVGALTVNPLTDAPVAQNLDGVYLGRSSGAAGLSFYDLERVEVLKGPQGTLYGRNATGGVINYIPRKPVIGEEAGFAQVEYGNFNKIGLQGGVNIPLGDKAALRVAGSSLNRDGYSDDGTNDAESWSLRGQLLFEPTDALSVRVAADYSENNALGPGGDLVGNFSTTPGQLTDFTPSGIDIDTGPTADEANDIRNTVLQTPSFAFFPDIDVDELFQDLSFTGVMAEINYETDFGEFTVIPAYRAHNQNYAFVGPAFAPALTSEEQDQWSLEARFASDFDGPLNGIIGAFYIDEAIETSTNFRQAFSSPIQNFENGGDSWAVFGQATFELTENLRLNGGIRYTEDNKFVEGVSNTFVTFCGGAPFGPPPNLLTPPASFANGCAVPGNIPAHGLVSTPEDFVADLIERGFIAPTSTVEDGRFPILRQPGDTNPDLLALIIDVGDGALVSDLNFGEVTGRAGVEWDWGPSNLLYAGYERGFRAGGVDLGVGNPTFDSEFIDAYTIGSKNRFLSDTLQFNAEAFFWKYKDQQISYFTTLNSQATFPVANGDATIFGLDVNAIWAVGENTTVSGNAQYLNSTYDSLSLISDPGVGRFGCDSAGVVDGVESFDCSGQSLLFSPEFGADMSVNHIIDIANYDLSLTGDVSYRAEQGTSFAFLDETDSDAYVTLGLAAAFSPDNAGWSVTGYVRNVTDERYINNSNVQNRGLFHAGFNPPRTYGVRVRADF